MADGEGVAGQVQLGAGPDPAVAVEGGDGDAGQPEGRAVGTGRHRAVGTGRHRAAAVGAYDRVAGEDRHAVAQQASGVPGAFGQLACQGRDMAREPSGGGGLHQRGDLDPGGREPGRHGQQQRSRPGHDGPAPRHHEPALEHGLGAAGGDDAGEGPAGEGQHLLVAAGGQDHGTGVHLGRLLLLRPQQRVHGEAVGPALHGPHMVIRQHADGTGGESVPQPLPGPPPVVQRLGPPGPEPGGGLPVELPARLGRGVDQGDPYAACAGRQGGGEAGRSGADHGEVSAHGAPPRGPSRPGCRSRRPAAPAPGRPAGWAAR